MLLHLLYLVQGIPVMYKYPSESLFENFNMGTVLLVVKLTFAPQNLLAV